MRFQSRIASECALIGLVCGCSSSVQLGQPREGRGEGLSESTLGSPAPLVFEENQGQTDPAVLYLARASNSTVYFTGDSLVIVAWEVPVEGEPAVGSVVRIAFEGANPSGFESREPLASRSNYFFGSESGWRTNVPHFASIAAKEIFPGIDLILHGNESQEVQFDFVVAPGADPSALSIRIDSAEEPSTSSRGDLVIPTASGFLLQRAPIVYQENGSSRRIIDSRYVLNGRQARFKLGNFDRTRTLVIDPAVAYAVVLPTEVSEQVSTTAIDVDAAGSAFLAGGTNSLSFPLQDPLQATIQASENGFVTKLSPDGSSLIFSTYLGTGGTSSLALTTDGSAVLTGLTFSAEFPLVGAAQPVFGGGGTDGFVTRVSPGGDQLAYSTYLGGSGNDVPAAIAAGPDGAVYLTGLTTSLNFPTTPDAPAASYSGSGTATFVTKVSAAGTIEFSTYFGSRAIQGRAIAADADGAMYVAGAASGDSFTPVNSFQPAFGGGGSDGFVAKLSPAGTVLFATLVGGDDQDRIDKVVLGAGGLHLAGTTSSTNFPTSPGSLPLLPIYATPYAQKIFLLGVTNDGSRSYSTLFGEDFGGGITGLELAGPAELMICAGGLGSNTTYPEERVPGLYWYSGNYFKASVDLAPLNVLGITKFLGGNVGLCSLDPAGSSYIASPYLEPDPLTGEAALAWIVKISDVGVADDSFVTDEDVTLLVSPPGVLANDSPGQAVLVVPPLHASAFDLGADGSFSFVPVVDFHGEDSFQYRVRSGEDESGLARVSIDVRPVPDAPIASPDTFGIAFGTTLTVPATGVLANDSDADADLLSAVFVSGPLHGVLSFLADGSFIYEPNYGFSGSDSFQYRAFDGTLSSTPTTVSIVVGASSAPDTFITVGPSGVTNDITVTFAFTASLADSSFECSVDDSTFSGCVSPLSVGPLTFADHRFAVRAVSSGGAPDTTPAERDFSVAPDTILQSAPPTRSTLAAVTFAFTSNDPEASFQCSFDAAVSTPCASPVDVDPVAEGAHSFTVRAVHGGTLLDPTPAIHLYEVDRTAPMVTLVSPLDGAAVQSSPIAVTVSLDEAAVVTGSSLFSAGTMLPVGTSNATVSLRPGYNSFSTFVRDDLGNSSLSTFHLFLDATPPTLVFLSPQNAASTYHSPIDVLVSLSEDVTIVTSSPGFLSPIGGLLSGGERTLRLSLVAGLNEFSATLRDRAGNETVYSGPSAFSLSLATQRPPAPQISSPAPDTVFGERVAAVTGTAAGNAARVQITGANTVSVPVMGGNWSGTVTLPEGASRIRAKAFSAAGAASPETSVPVSAGGMRLIAVDSGNEQLGPTGVTLALPLSARVTDVSGEPLSGISVTFSLDVEPVTLDGSLGGTGKTATALTDGAGRASVPLTLATSHVNAQGVMQPTLVTATVPSLSGTRAVFAAQGLPVASFGGTGTPTYLIPIGRDCTTAPDHPVGSCPLSAAGSVVSGFAVAVLDETHRLLPNAGVDFTAARGTFVGSPTIHFQTGSDGIARSGPFTLSQTIPNPEGLFVMLRPDDLAATPLQIHGVTASLSALSSVQMGFAAYAHAGPAARVVDASMGSIGGWPGIPTSAALIGRVEDAFGNPVANASLTFTVVPINDPDDPGAKLFRSDPTASSASRCTHVLSKNDDACTVDSLSATTFSAGTAWTQLAMGLRGFTPYHVTATAAGASPVTFTRRSSYVATAQLISSWLVLQGSATAAATFAILRTENDDADALTAVTWRSSCYRPAGTPIGQALCASPSRDGRKITFDAVGAFDASGGPHFNPPFAFPFQQTSIADGQEEVAPGEGRALLVGGAIAGGLGLQISVSSFGRTITTGWSGAQAESTYSEWIPRMSMQCAEFSTITPRAYCGQDPEATLCRPDEAGVRSFVDLENGYTEDNLVVLRFVHPSISPVPFRAIQKLERTLELSSNPSDVATPVDYFAKVVGSPGVPGLYSLGAGRLGPGADGVTRIELSPGHESCVEFVSKSFQRNGEPDRKNEGEVVVLPATRPPQPQLLLSLEDGESLGGLVLPGWVDDLTRKRDGERRGAIGFNGVIDWVETRAWDILESPVTPPPDGVEIPGGGPEGDDFNLPTGVHVLPLEVVEAFEGVTEIRSPIETRDFLGFTPLLRDTEIPLPPNRDAWHVPTRIEINVAQGSIRTDEPVLLEFKPYEIVRVSVANTFFHTVAHEARHVWQQLLLVDPRPLFCNDEAPDCGPTPNDLPDNNDDFVFYIDQGTFATNPLDPIDEWAIKDCLPERAILRDGTDISRGSARALIDTASNLDFPRDTFSGETPGGEIASQQADTCEGVLSRGTKARERDSIRFARAVERARKGL